MSFLNIRSFLPQRTPSSEGPLNGKTIPRKISSSSGGDPSTLFNAGSPGSSTSSNHIRYEEPVRLFIVDRRRAVLEKIIEPQQEMYNLNENAELPPQPNVYLDDQYVDNSNGSSWAFRFDFQKWNETNNIDEICIQNFCSFLDREHGQMSIRPGQSNSESQSGHATASILTPPHSGEQQAHPNGHAGTGPVHDEIPTNYHFLPSAQAANVPQQKVELDSETCQAMRDLSAGRVERLASSLRCLTPSHIIFRDHSCYPHRPTLLIFWFLEKLQFHASRLTFDGIQSNTPIPLDTLINFEDLQELTVIQPTQRPAFTVTGQLMLNWLKADIFTRRPLRLVLRGCDNLTGTDLAQFIIGWRKTPVPLIFDSISVDTSSVSITDFLYQVDNPCSNRETDWRPLTPPNCSTYGIPLPQLEPCMRQHTFQHPRGNACIHYRFADGHLVFTCLPMKSVPKSLTMPRASSAQSFRQLQLQSGVGRMYRSGSTVQGYNPVDQVPNNSFVGKMFGYIMRSNA